MHCAGYSSWNGWKNTTASPGAQSARRHTAKPSVAPAPAVRLSSASAGRRIELGVVGGDGHTEGRRAKREVVLVEHVSRGAGLGNGTDRSSVRPSRGRLGLAPSRSAPGGQRIDRAAARWGTPARGWSRRAGCPARHQRMVLSGGVRAPTLATRPAHQLECPHTHQCAGEHAGRSAVEKAFLRRQRDRPRAVRRQERATAGLKRPAKSRLYINVCGPVASRSARPLQRPFEAPARGRVRRRAARRSSARPRAAGAACCT